MSEVVGGLADALRIEALRSHINELLDQYEATGTDPQHNTTRSEIASAVTRTLFSIRKMRRASAEKQQQVRVPDVHVSAPPALQPAAPKARRITDAEFEALKTRRGWKRSVATRSWRGRCAKCDEKSVPGHRLQYDPKSGRPSVWEHFDCDNPFLMQPVGEQQGRLL